MITRAEFYLTFAMRSAGVVEPACTGTIRRCVSRANQTISGYGRSAWFTKPRL